MLNILESLNDVTKIEKGGFMVDSLVLIEGQNPADFEDDSDGYYETDHDQRKMQLILSDPVHRVVLKDYLQSQVRFFSHFDEILYIFFLVYFNYVSATD